MSYAERRAIIARIEAVRGSKLIAFVLSDRTSILPVPGLPVNLDSESHIHLIDHLRAIGKQERLDLFLHTRGGSTDAVWPLVSLLREYCDKLTVIVPFRAHSAGTLICLGADEIVMTNWAELSPIDPTTGNQFNPGDPTNPAAKLGISVEDVTAYFQLAKDLAGIKDEDHTAEVFKQLAGVVHPLALGNVQRVYMMIRRLADRLLSIHLHGPENAKRIKLIITGLAAEFFSHVHAITRKEATDLLGNWVRPPSEQEEPLVTELFEAYAEALELRTKFSLPEYMGDNPTRDLSIIGGLLESTAMSHVYSTQIKVGQRPQLPPNVQVQLPPGATIPFGPWVGRFFDYSIQNMGWRRDNA